MLNCWSLFDLCLYVENSKFGVPNLLRQIFKARRQVLQQVLYLYDRFRYLLYAIPLTVGWHIRFRHDYRLSIHAEAIWMDVKWFFLDTYNAHAKRRGLPRPLEHDVRRFL